MIFCDEVDNIVKMQKDFKKLYNGTGLIAIHSDYIHIESNEFLRNFTRYETFPHSEDKVELVTYYEGVKFIALEKRLEHE